MDPVLRVSPPPLSILVSAPAVIHHAAGGISCHLPHVSPNRQTHHNHRLSTQHGAANSVHAENACRTGHSNQLISQQVQQYLPNTDQDYPAISQPSDRCGASYNVPLQSHPSMLQSEAADKAKNPN
ncbi:hypothetical protein CEUSTIGMA_g7414.t1 [Chlamydomonas eustigma]|uniref:Uncharacterized protein n=1 Tax=Chlamydomonas eustigma TaxID=1157962 RepID=A0A250XA44_9CHLO|nr:hypothetical protein CEUSTIGMA_g7414.t1 [Chlamydomonas eustigma]|eukprot:GAX79975.1 hypothetical protein CEUSTIGMA_g7414.t1 [Chlamydomonas eustigma]